MGWFPVIVIAVILLGAFVWHRRRRKRWTILALDGEGKIQPLDEPAFPFEERDQAVARLKERWPNAMRMELSVIRGTVSEDDHSTLNLISQHSELHIVHDEEGDINWVMVVPAYYRGVASEAMQAFTERKSDLF